MEKRENSWFLSKTHLAFPLMRKVRQTSSAAVRDATSSTQIDWKIEEDQALALGVGLGFAVLPPTTSNQSLTAAQ